MLRPPEKIKNHTLGVCGSSGVKLPLDKSLRTSERLEKTKGLHSVWISAPVPFSVLVFNTLYPVLLL